MIPERFPEVNGTLLGWPADGERVAVGDLPVCKAGGAIVSQWQMRWSERIRALLSGRVWLIVHAPSTHPPVWLTTEDPFDA